MMATVNIFVMILGDNCKILSLNVNINKWPDFKTAMHVIISNIRK